MELFSIRIQRTFQLVSTPEWLTMDEILEYSKKMIAQEE